jgi:hypothetical protein
MPSNFSPSLRIELIGAGEQSGTWNNTTNKNLGDLIEQAISGATTLNVTSGDITLTELNGIVDQSRSAVLIVTGTPGTTRSVVIPNVSKTYTVKNNSDSIVQIKTASGIAYSMVSGSEAYVYCNGSNVVTGRSISTNGDTLISAVQPSSVAQSLGIAPTVSPALTGTPTAPTALQGTNTTQLATTAFVQAALQAVYPIGSVYINAISTSSPATLFGFGTWAEIGAGRVLVGQNASDASFDSLGDTGGSKDATLVSHDHTISGSGTSGDNSVDHNHGININSGNNNVGHTHTASYNDNYLSRMVSANGADGFEIGVGQSGLSGSCRTGGGDGGFTSLRVQNAGTNTKSLTTETQSVNHIHNVNGTSGIQSANHNHSVSITGTSNSQGSSATNANLQPYIVVKMWQRTA